MIRPDSLRLKKLNQIRRKFPMKADKMVLATIAATFLLIALIAWAFYHTLKSGHADKIGAYPEKEVMVQAKALQTSRLDELAKNGQVVLGMNMAQVRLAKGEPVRTETIAADSLNSETIWWYQHDGWMSIVFNAEGAVETVEKVQSL